MFLNKKFIGISTVEVIIVLAISATLFVIAISTINIRKRTEVDDAARQVMSEIARVRNQAQQGLGPTTDQGRQILSTNGPNELFGQAIEFVQSNCPAVQDSCIKIYKLMETPSKQIMVYEQEEFKLPQQLAWYLPYENPPNCSNFTSCYTRFGTNTVVDLTNPPINQGTFVWSVILVFRNNSGQSYVFNRATFATDSRNVGGKSITLPSMSPQAQLAPTAAGSKYISEHQGKLRIAFARPGNGSDLNARMANAPYQYYANFDLSIPNNQSLEVFK